MNKKIGKTESKKIEKTEIKKNITIPKKKKIKKMTDKDNQKKGSYISHLVELRSRLIKSFIFFLFNKVL